MDATQFRQIATLQADWNPAVRALWYDAQGDWTTAHDQVQDDNSADGAWVHAYLHRVEGDQFNAAYWYRRAGRAVPAKNLALGDEWTQLVQALVKE
jgi:hypothetical protein